MSDRSAPVGLTQRLRNYLLAGIIVSAPITITLFIVWQVLAYVDRTVTPFIPTAYNPENYLPFGLPGIGLVIILGLLTLIGWLAAGLVGRTVMRTGERLLDPLSVLPCFSVPPLSISLTPPLRAPLHAPWRCGCTGRSALP